MLITGESGTGKELLAQEIQSSSSRADEAFIIVNCATLPVELVESLLFGHEQGAFTGAQQSKVGRVQFADGGTLFLDEIADIGPAVQSKLLRVLQDGVVKRVGSNFGRSVDLRFIAALSFSTSSASTTMRSCEAPTRARKRSTRPPISSSERTIAGVRCP